jgi:hypothetical protein
VVRDHNGHPVAGLAVTSADGLPERHSEAVIATARGLTERLGGVTDVTAAPLSPRDRRQKERP